MENSTDRMANALTPGQPKNIVLVAAGTKNPMVA